MTKQERQKLRRAVSLLLDDNREESTWDEALEILCQLIDPTFKPRKLGPAIPWTEAFTHELSSDNKSAVDDGEPT